MTQAEIITRVKDRLDEDATTSQRYTDADITEYTLDGARYYVSSTGCQNSIVKIVQTARTLLYDLPCDFIQVERVLWWRGFSEYVSVEPIQPRTLDNEVWQWQRQTDTRSRGYFIVAPRRIGLWPLSADGGEEYFVHYQRDVYNDLSAVPAEDHEAIVEYCLARCLLADGKTEYGLEAYQQFRRRVDGAKRRLASMDRQWEMSVVGMGSRV